MQNVVISPISLPFVKSRGQMIFQPPLLGKLRSLKPIIKMEGRMSEWKNSTRTIVVGGSKKLFASQVRIHITDVSMEFMEP